MCTFTLFLVTHISETQLTEGNHRENLLDQVAKALVRFPECILQRQSRLSHTPSLGFPTCHGSPGSAAHPSTWKEEMRVISCHGHLLE